MSIKLGIAGLAARYFLKRNIFQNPVKKIG
jgi:hypothetical protein